MDFQLTYKSKLTQAEEAIGLVRDGDTIVVPTAAAAVPGCEGVADPADRGGMATSIPRRRSMCGMWPISSGWPPAAAGRRGQPCVQLS